jgi:hypothetical protein
MSSYNAPAAVGSANATGAESITIGDTAATTNNNGNLTDSAGNLQVDFVWGNFPKQPNDERADGTPTATTTYGAAQNGQWTTKSTIASARLNPALGNHAEIEAEWANFPSFVEAAGNYMVTAASGNGTTVTYTSQNELAAGDVVNITGLTASAYNLSSATVATANPLKFTVTDAANAGEVTGQWYGKVQLTTAASAADGAGIGYINVPAVVGNTTAVALDTLKDAGYEAANITTATAATNAAISVTAAARTAGSTTATLTATGAGAAFPVGTRITVASLADTGAPLNGTYTVTAVATNTVSFVSSASTVLALTELVAGTIVGVAGTIKSQSVAAGTGSVASTATISITPYAAATTS